MNKNGLKNMETFLSKMLVCDYIPGNQDRHYQNFGVIRNVETLEYTRIAPIFDSGNSLWYRSESLVGPRDYDYIAKPFGCSSFHARTEKAVDLDQEQPSLDRAAQDASAASSESDLKIGNGTIGITLNGSCKDWYTSAMQLTKYDIAEIVERVLADYDVEKAYLFGSFARGDVHDSSDVDLRLVCGPDMTFGCLYELTERLESELGREVEIVTNPLELMRPPFRKRIEKDEVLLYGAA